MAAISRRDGNVSDPIELTSSTEGTLYFAFGSNLSITQMKMRCPSSATPLAVARLDGYDWLINERGYANVINLNKTTVPPFTADRFRDTASDVQQSPITTSVWGLLYVLTARDEAKLDVYEGWNITSANGANPSIEERKWKPMIQGSCDYNKLYLLVDVEKWLVDEDTLPSMYGINAQSDDNDQAGSKNAKVKVLIYVDEERPTPGTIKSEYIYRMSRAVSESVSLGIPLSWVRDRMEVHGIRVL